MNQLIGHRAYLTVVLASALLACLVTVLAVWTHRASQCRASSVKDAYLAYCGQPKYGDYEHGAFYLNLEPGLASHLRSADVLFAGSSQAQYGFSTEATRRFFAQRTVRHYLMGFGYNEGSLFPTEIIAGLRLAPKVVVISTDNFPGSYLSPPAQSLIEARLGERLNYLAKSVANRLSRLTCDLVQGVCSRQFASLYRAIEDGHWLFAQNDALPAIPIDPEKHVSIPRDTFPERIAAAREFVRRAGVAGECVVVTASPNGQVDWEPLARDIGRALSSPVVLPRLAGLATFDDIHLTPASAERWSAAVLAGIGPVLDRCLP